MLRIEVSPRWQPTLAEAYPNRRSGWVRVVPARPQPYPQNAHSRFTPHLRVSVVWSFVSPVPLRPCVACPCVSNQWSTAMYERDRDVPACVYELANCLDAILASCEDLQSTTAEPSTLMPLERLAVAHVLQAHQHIHKFDPFRPGLVHDCAHFLVATSQLSAHLQSDNTASSSQQRFLPLADDHLIGGQVRLSELADEAGKLLDALEAHFLLYDEDFDDEQLPESEPLVYWATVAEPPGGKWWRWPRRSHSAR